MSNMEKTLSVFLAVLIVLSSFAAAPVAASAAQRIFDADKWVKGDKTADDVYRFDDLYENVVFVRATPDEEFAYQVDTGLDRTPELTVDNTLYTAKGVDAEGLIEGEWSEYGSTADEASVYLLDKLDSVEADWYAYTWQSFEAEEFPESEPSFDEETQSYVNGNTEYFRAGDRCFVQRGGAYAQVPYDETQVPAIVYEALKDDEGFVTGAAVSDYNIVYDKLVIPDTVPEDYPDESLRGAAVTAINDYVFISDYDLTEVVLGDNVRTIGMSAFDTCRSLKSVEIGSSLESIGLNAFFNCPLLSSVICLSEKESMTISSSFNTDDITFTGYHGSGLKKALEAWHDEKAVPYTFIGCDDHTQGDTDAEWSEEHDFVTAEIRCGGCDLTDTATADEVAVTTESVQSCAVDGVVTYEATVHSDIFDKDITLTDKIVSPAFGHSLEHHEAVAPEYDPDNEGYTDGNIEYWYCSTCEKFFSDEDCTDEITEDDTVLRYFVFTDHGDDGVGVSGYFGSDEDITVPDTVPDSYFDEELRGKEIIFVDADAFKDNAALKSVKLGDKIRTIGWEAFMGCSGLETVEIGSGIKTVSARSFFGCDSLKAFICTMTEVEDFSVDTYAFDTKSGFEVYGHHEGAFRDYADGHKFRSEYDTAEFSYIGLDDHTAGEAEWSWGEDHESAYAEIHCAYCDYTEALESDRVVSEEELSPEPSCNDRGTVTYSASVYSGTFDETFTGTDIITVKGHDPERFSENPPGYDASSDKYTDGNTEYWRCRSCGKYFSDEACEHEIALEDTVVHYFDFSASGDDEAELIKYNGENDEVVVPDTVPEDYSDESLRGITVTSIGASAFSDCAALSAIVMGDEIYFIGWQAFKGCRNLEKVEIGSGLVEISAEAFFDCDSLVRFTCRNTEERMYFTPYVFNTETGFTVCGYHSGEFYELAHSDKLSSSSGRGDFPYIGIDDHIFGSDQPVWSWDDEHKSATAAFSCSGCTFETTLDAVVTSETLPDRIDYTATVEYNGREYSSTESVYTAFVTGYSISLRDEIAINYYAYIDEGAYDGEITAVYSYGTGDTKVTADAAVDNAFDGARYDGSNCCFTCRINSRSMTDIVTLTIKAGDKEILSDAYRIVDYADDAAQTYGDNADLKKLLCDMLDYGASVQKHFKYRQDDLANSAEYIGKIDPNWSQSSTPEKLDDSTGFKNHRDELSELGIAFKGSTMTATGKTDIRLYFTLENGSKLPETKVYDASNGDSECEFEWVYNEKRAMYYLAVTGIPAKRIFDEYKVTFDGKVSCVYDPAQYYNSAISGTDATFRDVMQRMYTYCDSAKKV